MTMQSNTSGFTVYREDCKALMMSCLLLVEILDCLSHETLIVLLHCMWLWKLTNSITGISFDYQCYDGPVCLGFGCCQISKHTYLHSHQPETGVKNLTETTFFIFCLSRKDALDPVCILGQFSAGVGTADYLLHGLTLESPRVCLIVHRS